MASFDPELINLIGMSTEDPISQAGTAGSELEYPKSLPTLGVKDWVVFPGLAAPLIIDTPQGSKLVEAVMAGSRLMILSLQVEREGDGLRLDQVHPVGCVARLMKLLRFPDGTVRVLVEGVSRAKLVDTVSESPYLEVKFTAIDEVIERSNYFSALVQTTRKQFQELASVSQFINDHVKLAALNRLNRPVGLISSLKNRP